MTKLNVWHGHAWFLSSNVPTGNFDLNEGQEYKTDGLEITPDHQFATIEPYGKGNYYMPCFVILHPNFWEKIINLLTFNSVSHPWGKNIKKKTKIRIDQIITINFNNSFDDSCYSFQKGEKQHGN